jgi:hypothetical protein
MFRRGCALKYTHYYSVFLVMTRLIESVTIEISVILSVLIQVDYYPQLAGY